MSREFIITAHATFEDMKVREPERSVLQSEITLMSEELKGGLREDGVIEGDFPSLLSVMAVPGGNSRGKSIVSAGVQGELDNSCLSPPIVGNDDNNTTTLPSSNYQLREE